MDLSEHVQNGRNTLERNPLVTLLQALHCSFRNPTVLRKRSAHEPRSPRAGQTFAQAAEATSPPNILHNVAHVEAATTKLGLARGS
jgi:hypothetical protein